MPPTTPAAVKADPNVFAANFLAGMEAGDINTQYSARMGRMKENWHLFRDFIAWVASGDDVKEYEAKQALIEAKAKRAAEVAAADAAAEAERHAKAAAMHGSK